jgi:hypothetical protein
MVPHLMTEAINQMAFVPGSLMIIHLHGSANVKCAAYQKNHSQPALQTNFHSAVLYKISSCILARRLNQVLPTIIGPHQHGYMAQKGIQEPTILGTHIIQEEKYNHKSLQLVSFDIKKSFDRVSHTSIVQALRDLDSQKL